MDDFRREMGTRMKTRRKEMNLTQEHMAELLNISVKHYGGVERGNAGLSLENLIEVCKILNIDLDYLVRGKSKKMDYLPDRISQIYFNSSRQKQESILAILEIMDKL